MKHRLCVPGLADPPGTTIALDPDRAHYLSRVLRLKAGAPVGLFDGRGSEWRAAIARISGKSVSVEVVALERTAPEPTPLILAQAWLKGSAMDAVVQKAVELGATGIWLLTGTRSNVRLDERRLANKLSHLKKVIVSAAEQSETLWLPDLDTFADLSAVLDAQPPGRTLFFDIGQPALATTGEPEPLTLVIGPEGGWSDEERALADARQVTRVGLGELTLRAETAPLAALAAVRQSWGWRR